MRLFVVTQAVDVRDPVLGFFVGWVGELAKHFERIEVVCLREGEHAFPANVGVHSLGKERGRPVFGAAAYALRFLALAWHLRESYDAVLVHMNQEYILIAGWLWKIFGKRVFLWRNHYAGSLLTDFAAAFSTKVLYTSRSSYTARYEKAVRMPVGVDTARFHPDGTTLRVPGSILFLARMAPSKRPEILVDALARLTRKNIDFTATFVGSPRSQDTTYYKRLMARVESLGLSNHVIFTPGLPNIETPALYRSHDIFVNASPSGMLDKTIFEAAASGCAVLASSEDIKEQLGDEYYFATVDELADKLQKLISSPSTHREQLAKLAEDNSLLQLGVTLTQAIGV